MTKPLARLLIILAIVVVGCTITKRIIFYGVMHFTDDQEKYTKLFRGKEAYDILLLGSSRMQNMINPRLLDSLTGYTSYNSGSEGAGIREMKMIFDAYLATHPAPKWVVLNLDYFSFATGDRSLSSFIKYLPFKDVPQVGALLKEDGVHVDLYRALPFLENAELDEYYKGMIVHVLRHERKLSHGDFFYKGYESNGSDTIKEETSPPPASKNPAPHTKEALQEIIHTCQVRHISLMLTYAPEYHHNNARSITNFAEIMKYDDSVAKANGIIFHRNDSLSICNDRRLFANAGHLNIEGARIYTRIIASQLEALGCRKNN